MPFASYTRTLALLFAIVSTLPIRAQILHLTELNPIRIRIRTVILIPNGIVEEHGPTPTFTDGYLYEAVNKPNGS